MRTLCALLALLPASLLLAAEPGEHGYWSAAELAGGLRGRLIDEGNYFAVMVHREPGPGFSESHRDWTDVYFVTDGTGSLIVGGTIPEPREDDPGEVRGSSIDGGERRRLAKGDVVHIPPGTPHHVVVEPGATLSYLLVKIAKSAD